MPSRSHSSAILPSAWIISTSFSFSRGTSTTTPIAPRNTASCTEPKKISW